MEMNISAKAARPLPIDANLTIAVRFGNNPHLGVDLPHEQDYTVGIEVMVLCEQIPTRKRNSAESTRVFACFFLFQS